MHTSNKTHVASRVQ